MVYLSETCFVIRENSTVVSDDQRIIITITKLRSLEEISIFEYVFFFSGDSITNDCAGGKAVGLERSS